MLDYLIKNATVVDGTGKAAYTASVGVEDDRIATIITEGELPEAKKIIDAKGSLLTPGFIDIHSHADCTLLHDATGDNMIVQGVTTHVSGNCGVSVAPAHNAEYVEGFIKPRWPKYWPNHKEISWKTFDEWLEFAGKIPQGTNYVPVVGLNELRGSVMGMDYSRVATEEERAKLVELLDEALDAGAFGMTISMDPGVPGHFADRAEIEQLFKRLEERDSYVSSHTRHHQSQWPSEDGRHFYGVFVGEKSDVNCGRYHGLLEFMEQFKCAPKLTACYSHLTNAFVAPMPHSQAMEDAMLEDTLRIFVDEPAAEGYPVYFNIIPHEHSVGAIQNVAENLTRSMVYEAKYQDFANVEALLEKLKDSAFREEFKKFLKSGRVKIGMLSPAVDAYWCDCFTFVEAKDKTVLGKTLLEVTKERKPGYYDQVLYENCYDVMFEMILDDSGLAWAMTRDKREYQAVRKLASHPRCMPMTDSGSFAITEDKWIGNGINNGTYPLAFTAFVRYLVDVSRDGGCISMEEAIRKVTSLPAEVVKLKDRGRIEKGMYADLVLLDWEKLGYTIDFNKPTLPPDGIRYVWVNGIPALEEGVLTHALTGRVLRKTLSEA
ncbi:MAG: amidohydrolase family protein [Oscillibacter sp.]|nr:amidohydrolase family protein [Oscillibacter sp.]